MPSRSSLIAGEPRDGEWRFERALLAEDVIESVGRCLWTFAMPKMLRPCFRHHRQLLGALSRAGWEVVREPEKVPGASPA